MRYATVCSGVEACSVAWHGLGWQPVFFSEIEKFPCAVLAHHYPNTPNLGDMTKIDGTKYRGSIDLICGGTPCQSFSIAGLRGGLTDERGNLALEFCRLVDEIRPEWVIWENVPGVLSSNKGRDFGSILGALGHLGYGWAYRVLDAQYFGVPQRRRRVFVVGHIGGDWQRAAAVLFEQGGLRGDTAPRRKEGQGVTGYTPSSFGGYVEGCGTLRKSGGDYGPGSEIRISEPGPGKGDWPQEIAPTLDRSFGHLQGQDNQHIDGGGGLFVMATGQTNAEIRAGQSPALTCNHEAPIVFLPKDAQFSIDQECNASPIDEPVGALLKGSPTGGGWPLPAICFTVRGGKEGGGKGYLGAENKSPTLTKVPHNYFVPGGQLHYIDGSYNPSQHIAGALTKSPSHSVPAVFMQNQRNEVRQLSVPGALSASGGTKQQNWLLHKAAVRRITPREAERLQGFPDNYTAIYGEKTPDTPRYAAMGNSMAVPVMEWIGRRIQLVQNMHAQ